MPPYTIIEGKLYEAQQVTIFEEKWKCSISNIRNSYDNDIDAHLEKQCVVSEARGQSNGIPKYMI